MFNWINKSRKKNLVLASIILVSLTLMTASIKRSPKPFFLETVFIWMVAPFQNIFANMVNSVEDVMDQYIFLGNVSKENKKLRYEMDILLGQNNELREKALQLGRVAGLMKYQANIGQIKTVATIIGRDATQWSKMVLPAAPALLGFDATRVVHQDLAHGARRDPQEVGPVFRGEARRGGERNVS